MDRDFRELLDARAAAGFAVCIGLDSSLDRLPASAYGVGDPQLAFNREIIDATADLAAAYKPNTAFYEARGAVGIEVLVATVEHARAAAPQVPVIVDAKRGDIGSTNDGYASFLFDVVGADAITVHPYLGSEAAKAFLDRPDKGVFVLCRTSNAGAGELQDLPVHTNGRTRPLYEVVAERVVATWNTRRNCGLVVGATYPGELADIRRLAPELPLLVPGIGAQGGDLGSTLDAVQAVKGAPVLINSSRGIIFAGEGPDYAERARAATADLDQAVRRGRA